MYKVCVSYLDTFDEWGYPCEYYDFNTSNEAEAFCALKKADYTDNELVSVDLCF